MNMKSVPAVDNMELCCALVLPEKESLKDLVLTLNPQTNCFGHNSRLKNHLFKIFEMDEFLSIFFYLAFIIMVVNN